MRSLRLFVLATVVTVLCVGCREDGPADVVERDARAHLECDEIHVTYAGAYEGDDDAQIELYEVSSPCGDVAYRCEVFEDDATLFSDCCRFGDEACDR